MAARIEWRTSLVVVVGDDGTLNEVVNGPRGGPANGASGGR